MSTKKRSRAYHGLITITAAALVLIIIASCQSQPATTTPTTTTGTTTTATTPTTTTTGTTTTATTPTTTIVTPTKTFAGLRLASFIIDDFTGSANCALCHTSLSDAAGNDVSIDTHWRSTMMANAAKDPFWQAMVASEVSRNPQLKEVIEDKCSSCHMPMAYTQAETDGSSTLMFGDGFLNEANPLNIAAMDGNSCSLCHQIVDPVPGTYYIDTSTDIPDRLLYGPYEGYRESFMQSTVGYTPLYGEQVTQSILCATCHSVTTPYVDNDGSVQGTFPEQTPYEETLNSIYPGQGTECQTCHMPLAGSAVAISGGMPERELFWQHHFIGGNSLILEILKDNIDQLAVTASTGNFNATLDRLAQQLDNDTATLTIKEAGMDGNILSLSLNLEQLVGHKFPTGFPSRRAWIHLSVTDNNGNTVFESGKPNADGSISGNNADENATGYEPHYSLITQPDQVQIYESIMNNTNGDVTYTLLRASGYLKDNRLLPLGFDKQNAATNIAAYGEAAGDADFSGGSDSITYRIDTGSHSGPFTVKAELLYQTLSYRFAMDLFSTNEALVEEFAAYFNQADKMPTLIASASQSVS